MRPLNTVDKILPLPCYYLTRKKDDFNKIPELQVCLAEAETRQGQQTFILSYLTIY